jgi:lytic starch monooxygenase
VTAAHSHAGGYQYRLAPAAGSLLESDFQKTPLQFVGQQGLRWGGGPQHGGTEIWFNGTYVSEGTVPLGSTWVQNPIPREHGFPPHCADPAQCTGNRPAPVRE